MQQAVSGGFSRGTTTPGCASSCSTSAPFPSHSLISNRQILKVGSLQLIENTARHSTLIAKNPGRSISGAQPLYAENKCQALPGVFGRKLLKTLIRDSKQVSKNSIGFSTSNPELPTRELGLKPRRELAPNRVICSVSQLKSGREERNA